MPAWPATLPQDQFLGLIDVDQDAVLRTPMDTGPPTRRNRFNAITRTVDVPLTVDGAQRQTFDTFFRTTLKNGALAFDWEDPVTDVIVSFAFRGPPSWVLLSGGAVSDRRWGSTLNLEIQP